MQTRATTERPCQGLVVVQLPLPLLSMLKAARGAVVARPIEKRHRRRIDIDRGHAEIPMMQIFKPRGFSVQDVENLRLHYEWTLRHWLERYSTAEDRVRRMFDERFVRTWRLYLAGSAAAFATGSLQLFQVVFRRPLDNDLPRSRGHLYNDA